MVSCPSCQKAVGPSAKVCPTCGWRFNTSDAAMPGPSIVRPATRPKIQTCVELGTTVDRTGSSAQFQSGIPETYEKILIQLEAKARSVKCWLASHGDLDEGQDFIIHTDGGIPKQAIEDVKKIVYGGGGDSPEHHLDAIEALLDRIPWSINPSRARGAILSFLTADTKPTRSGATAAELGKRIRDKGLLLYLVCEPTPTLQELVSAAEGLMFQISNDPNAAELQKIAGQLAASIVATVASGGTVPMSVPID